MDEQSPSIDEQRQFWDWHWTNEDDRRTRNEWKDRRHAAIVEYLESLQLSQPRILDIGCGSGWYTESLAHYGPTVGVDLSHEAIRRASKRFPNIEFVQGNLYDVPFPEASFDVVVAQEVFDHVEDQPRFVKRVSGLLRNGGYLLVSCTNKFVYERRGEGFFPKQPSEHIEKSLTMSQFRRTIGAHFQVLRSSSIIPFGQQGVLRIVNSPRLNRLMRVALSQRALDRIKERAGLGYQNILLARKS